ncbi:MAG: hypothetical protein HQ478_08470 [Chloroflexi bacterium]|nr:hypothetical protein [Chloroflexota bacterium]
MTLGWPAYDTQGHSFIGAGDQLSVDGIQQLQNYGIAELIIEDQKTSDIPVEPLVPPAEEAMLVQSIRQLVVELQASGSLEPALVDKMHQRLFAVATKMSESILGEPAIVGCSNPLVYDYVHPAQVSGLCIAIGGAAGLDIAQQANLATAAALMNVGYFGITEGLLLTPHQLTAAAWYEIIQHPANGKRLIDACGQLDASVSSIVAQSHERFDGTGYPNGAKGEEISQSARILGIVDTFYGLASVRPHRLAMMPHEAMEFIMAYSMELFDPKLVDIFVRKVPLYATGVSVRLDTNEVGVVADPNPGFVGRPIVRVFKDRHGEDLKDPYELDLSSPDQQREMITEVLDY